MKALLLTSRTYTKKTTGEVGSTGCAFYILPNGSPDTKQLFGFDVNEFPSGSIVNVEFDPRGFLVSMQKLGASDCFPMLSDELS